MTEYKKIEIAREAVRTYRSGGPVNGEVEGLSWSLDDKGAGLVVFTLGEEQFKVAGAQRLTVFPAKAVKRAVKAEKKPAAKKPRERSPKAARGATIEAKCTKCGKSFKLSKFTPYLTFCYDCRKKAIAKHELLPTSGKIKKTCKVTGKVFYVSKYNPYVDVSPEGRKLQHKKAAKRSA